MYLKEFEGSAIFARYGIDVPLSCVIAGELNDANDESWAVLDDFMDSNPGMDEFAVKAQLLRGHRGQTGAIVFADRGGLREAISDLNKQHFDGTDDYEILVEEKVNIEEELYLSVVLNRFERCRKLIFSRSGGVDIEEIANSDSSSVHEIDLDGGDGGDKNFIFDFYASICGVNRQLSERLTEITLKVLEIMEQEDATLVEINPLAVTETGRPVAVDSKIVIDDNAIFRHKEFLALEGRGLSEIEKKAHKMGLAYVELDGNLAIIGNGAGLVMSTLDAVNYYGAAAGIREGMTAGTREGTRAANFCDVGGGASRDVMGKALEIVLSKKSVKKILINIFGGITHCDEIAMGIIDKINAGDLDMPMCVRIVGTNEDEAAEMLDKAGVKTYKSFEDAVKAAALL